MRRTKKKQKKRGERYPETLIDSCQFYGVRWDQPSLEVLGKVAQGLLNLTELFKSQNVEIKSLLNVNAPSSQEQTETVK